MLFRSWVDEAKDIKATSLAQLAESDEKPKPKHGDYGFDGHKNPRLAAAQEWQEPPDQYNDWSRYKVTENIRNNNNDFSVILGNIFADLAALKPIESFNMRTLKVEQSSEENIRIEDSFKDVVLVPICDFHDFILNLRCMELQMIQDAAKQ